MKFNLMLRKSAFLRLLKTFVGILAILASAVLAKALYSQQIIAPIRGTGPIQSAKLPFAEIRYVGFSSDSKSIRVGSIKGEFVTLSTGDLKPTSKIEPKPPFAVAASATSHSHRLFALSEWKGEVLVFDSVTEEIRSQLPLKLVSGSKTVDAIAISRDETQIATGSRDSIVRMYLISSSELLWESQPLKQEIVSVAMSPNGKYVIASTGERTKTTEPGFAVVLDASDGREIHRWQEASSKVNAVLVTEDSRTVLVASNEALRAYELISGKLTYTKPEMVGNIRLQSVDDSRCIVAQYPGRIQIWDLKQARTIAIFAGHATKQNLSPPMIWTMDLSPDGKTLVTADITGQVYIWAMPD